MLKSLVDFSSMHQNKLHSFRKMESEVSQHLRILDLLFFLTCLVTTTLRNVNV